VRQINRRHSIQFDAVVGLVDCRAREQLRLRKTLCVAAVQLAKNKNKKQNKTKRQSIAIETSLQQMCFTFGSENSRGRGSVFSYNKASN
jgi:hypothetical protein